MAERKPRATKEEALNAKIAKIEEAKAKLMEKHGALEAAEDELRKLLKDLSEAKKKAERAAQAKAKREEDKKEKKELMKVIKDSGLSVDEVKAKLGI